MKITVLVNNFNYARFLPDCLESIAAQEQPAGQVLVVDDFSTDGSRAIIEEYCQRHSGWQAVLKPANGGQLSAFNAGAELVTGEIVAFLDADDRLRPGYLRRIVEFYTTHPHCDFLTCDAMFFGQEERRAGMYERTRDLGYSRCSALYASHWEGNRTSTVSMRTTMLRKVLPLPLEDDWRIRADDCLVYGTSLAGARKYYLAEPLVDYRVHGGNGHFGKTRERSPKEIELHGKRVRQLLDYYAGQFPGLQPLRFQHVREFFTIPSPSRQELERYGEINRRSELPPLLKRFCGLLLRLRFRFAGSRAQVESSSS